VIGLGIAVLAISTNASNTDKTNNNLKLGKRA
jgi:hypothetical protein